MTILADILFYNGPIERPSDQNIIDRCISRKRKENILLILVTYGGDADPAFRIAKCLQTKYEKFIFYASGYCKSAGTLIALGANEIIFSDHGELGPLDVQMNKEDDLFSLQSGNTVMDALGALQDKAFLSFEKTFLEIQKRSEGAITVKTAGEFATNLASGLFSNLFGQIDPLYVGESARALSIAHAYGERLIEDSENWTSEALEQLLSGYPSHGFVIDRHEAQNLFRYVREPDGDEIILTNIMGDYFRKPKHKGLPTIEFLNEEKVEEKLNLVAKSGGKIMNFQNKPTRDVKDFSLLELLRNKENTLRKGNRTTFDPQTNTHSSHEIEPITNSKEESIERPSA